MSRRIRVGLASLLICVALTACKEEVYSDINEREANEMVAVLAAAAINPKRRRDNDGVYTLLVEAADVPAAITILRDAGYPRESFESLGDVFEGDGVFGTPFEQHARYIHAMNQELSATITSIDGVRSAKVLVTAPPKGRFDTETPRATASVVIHHETGFDPRPELSTIKEIVAHALPNLDYEDVATASFAAGGPGSSPKAVPAGTATDTGQAQTPPGPTTAMVVGGGVLNRVAAAIDPLWALAFVAAAFAVGALVLRWRDDGDTP